MVPASGSRSNFTHQTFTVDVDTSGGPVFPLGSDESSPPKRPVRGKEDRPTQTDSETGRECPAPVVGERTGESVVESHWFGRLPS